MRTYPPTLRTRTRHLHRSSTANGVCLFLVATLFSLGTIVLVGCAEPVQSQDVDAAKPSPVPESEELQQRLEDVLRFTYEHRHLNLNDHAAWQILHGVLTYKQDFLIRQDAQGEDEFSAVDYILGGGEMKGWTVRPGTLITGTGRRGLIADLESGSGTGQGHYDQWLAVLAQCDLPPQGQIRVGRDVFTMQDFVDQVMLDVPNRRIDGGQFEYSWTLIGLSKYLPSDATWIARDGEPWSLERLVKVETDQARENLSMGACGGTHRLIGITMALNQHLGQGGELTGVWAEADEVINDSIAQIRRLQNNNGTLSTNWLDRPGVSSEVAERLSCTGHQLEFLTLALSDEQLQESWVKRAVASLCQLFEETQTLPLECGALYHASHGLALYHERMHGPLAWRTSEEDLAPLPPQAVGPGSPPVPTEPEDTAEDAAPTAGTAAESVPAAQ